MKALLIYPTHANCHEAAALYQAQRLQTVVFPARLTESTDEAHQNCWNLEADAAEAMGLSVVPAVCHTCQERQACSTAGYLADLKAAEEADVALCTHKRAEHAALRTLGKGRQYISIHENPIQLLRPTMEVTEPDLQAVRCVLGQILNDPESLNGFAEADRTDGEGNRYRDDQLAERKERQYECCLLLADVIDDLDQQLAITEQTTGWSSPKTGERAPGIERVLFRASRRAGAAFTGQPWRLLLAAIAGELVSAAIVVSERFEAGGTPGTTSIGKRVVGSQRNDPPYDATTWFNDATLDVDRLRQLVRREVTDATPSGRLLLCRKAVQIARDVTRRTSLKSVANVLRGVLADRPQFLRVGVICHRPHLKSLETLDADFQRRIVRTTYFGSGDDRSSNAWHAVCDLLVVLGTPRVPPDAIAAYLVQVGELEAARETPDWGEVRWEAETESGEPLVISGRGYRNVAWQRAQRELVRGSLVQAIGRGRGLLESGCEVVVISTEECGLVISDAGHEVLNAASARILAALQAATMENAKYITLGNSIVRATDLAARTGLSVVHVRQLLCALERRGLVKKVGERDGGWSLVPNAAEVPSVATPLESAFVEGHASG